MSAFGTAYGTASTYKPFAQNNVITGDPRYHFFFIKVQDACSPWSNMQGYEFDSDGVINKIYKDDSIIINLFKTECIDTYVTNRAVVSGVPVSEFSSTIYETGKLYVDTINYPNKRYQSGLDSTTPPTGTDIINSYPRWLYDIDTETSAGQLTKSGDNSMLNLSNTFYATHSATAEQNEYINVYNEVDAIIYAYPKDAKKLEYFCDPLSTYDKNAKGRRYQLALYTNQTSLYATFMGKSWYDQIGDGIQHRYGAIFPKLKLKNDTTIEALKPVFQATDDSGKKFNNLKQFRNGYMSYLDKDGKKCYPYSYGGVPLWTITDSGVENINFKFKCDATTAGVNKIRVWIKKGEFPNANYDPTSATWTATDTMTGKSHNDDLVNITVNDTTTTQKYVDITAGTEVTLKIDLPERGVTYFLRFSEVNTSGTCLNEGGKVTKLTNFLITK